MNRLTKRKATRQKHKQAIGLGWYSREQWEALTQVAPDRSELDDTHEAWEAQATDALRTLAAQGARPVKVQVDVQEFVAWCRGKGRPVDGESRADFVSHLLAKHSQAEHAFGS